MLLVFDGVCNLCNGFVRFLLARDAAGRLTFTTCQSEAGAEIMRQAGIDPLDPASVVLVDGNQTYVYSDASLLAIAALGGAWRLVLLARLIPRLLRDPAYRFVARRRYRWFGRSDTCRAPDPRWAGRFLV
jgi:predicted DCC family thiol-disulfide oxidoreductase YuxK